MNTNGKAGPYIKKISWISFALFSFSLFSFTFIRVDLHPTIIINTGNIPGVDPEKSTDPFLVPDAQNKNVLLSIWTLSAEQSWEIGFDGTTFDGHPAVLNGQYRTLPLSDQQKSILNSAEEIICIGASSQEFKSPLSKDEAIRAEESRAGRRANSIAEWVRSSLELNRDKSDSLYVAFLKYFGFMPPSPMRSIRKLNIGYWENSQQNKSTAETENQRRVIIVLVLRDKNGEYNFADDTALRNSFLKKADNGEQIYRYILDEYSKTKSLPFNWGN